MTGGARITLDMFLKWCQAARQNDLCQYHEGVVGRDRVNDPTLDEIADIAHLLSQTRYLRLSQMRVPGLTDDRCYLAIRTGTGFAPIAVLTGEMKARHHMALNVLAHREPSLSAARALRAGLGIQEVIAQGIIRDLNSAGLLEEAPSRGWNVTDKARRLMRAA
ncbi:MAG: hypothetical protein AAF674_16895 [Pseudomonadota bacterium]